MLFATIQHTIMPTWITATLCCPSLPHASLSEAEWQQHQADFFHLVRRVIGHVAFRHKMLARYGTVVDVPYKQGSSSVESMAGDIKAAVEAKTGSFRS